MFANVITCNTAASQYLVQGHRSLVSLHDSRGLGVGDLSFSKVLSVLHFGRYNLQLEHRHAVISFRFQNGKKQSIFNQWIIRDHRKSG